MTNKFRGTLWLFAVFLSLPFFSRAEIALRGVSNDSKGARFLLSSTENKTGEWVNLGGKFEGFIVLAFDPKTTVLTLEKDKVRTEMRQAADISFWDEYDSRAAAVMDLMSGPQAPDWNAVEKAARLLIRDFPARPDGYSFLLMSSSCAEMDGRLEHAANLCEEILSGSAPENYRLTARGSLKRLRNLKNRSK